jgi:hypothetical protein
LHLPNRIHSEYSASAILGNHQITAQLIWKQTARQFNFSEWVYFGVSVKLVLDKREGDEVNGSSS